jgi:glyoxylase-like metal-dependent hydrolase (beta-lactamase superfamily II)
LRDDLVQIEGVGGNVLVLGGPDGLAMVDSGSPEHSAGLLKLVSERLGGKAVHSLFNTHWHLPHTGANEALGEAGAKIIAHENTRLWMSTEFYVEWQDKTYAPRPAAALPSETFYSSDPQPIEVSFGSEQIEYGHLPEAHTDGDIYVFFRDRNVLAAGGAVAVGAYPVVDFSTGGWIGGLVDATKKLLDMTDAETLIVPGSGPVVSRAHLEAQHEMLTTIRGRIEDLMRQGKSADEMVAARVTAEFDAAWGNNRDLFVSNVYDGLWWGGRLGGAL